MAHAKVENETRIFCLLLLIIIGVGICTNSAFSSERAGQKQVVFPFYNIQSITASYKVIVASTQFGSVMTSYDMGKTWNNQILDSKSIIPPSIIGLSTCPDGTIIGADFHHKIWWTSDSAKSWHSVSVDEPKTILAVTCGLDNTWWVVGSYLTIADTRNQGKSWSVQSFKDDAQLTAIEFINATDGYAAGEFGNVLSTSDGGRTWARISKLKNANFYPYSMLFRSGGVVGWLSGVGGQTLETNDGGKTWQEVPNNSHVPLFHLFMVGVEPFGVGADGTVARFDGDAWVKVHYADPTHQLYDSGVSIPGHPDIVVGGLQGALRVIRVPKRFKNAEFR